MIRPYSMATRISPFDHLQVADTGDVPVNTYDLNLISGDLVDVSPPYDQFGNTAVLAANILYEMLCSYAMRSGWTQG